MEVFRVIEPGFLTTVQDMGRSGFRLDGISEGGAFDKFALWTVNKTLGNKPNTPALEITLLGPKLVTLNNTTIAISVADFGAKVNDKYVKLYTPINIEKGDIISFEGRKWGCRTYLAVKGGIFCDRIFKSFSTDVRIGFGGMKLTSGQIIKSANLKKKKTKLSYLPFINYHEIEKIYNLNEIGVIEGPDFEFFNDESYKIFYNSEYEVTRQLDRSGIRLIGSPIKRKQEEMLSRPTSCGNIQITPDGQPIILGVECQTIGGYPRIASVISADIPKLAQLVPTNKIRFKKTDVYTATAKLKSMFF